MQWVNRAPALDLRVRSELVHGRGLRGQVGLVYRRVRGPRVVLFTGGAGPVRELVIRGPLARSDLPGLYDRACAALAACPGGVLVCDVRGVSPDAVAVEALARLALGARRHNCRVELRGSGPELEGLIELAGLGAVFSPRTATAARRAGTESAY